jgi:transaldolase
VESDGTDGFVSLEVSPHLARKCEETMEEARRLYKKVDRLNCFIKIPGTQEGLPAIEEMLYEGIYINITLLFSVERYVEVAEAYIRALERRADEGKSVDNIASVASFFLSRIDVLVDKKLDSILDMESDESVKEIARDIRGETAIASAKIAYQKFQNIFNGERWEQLKEQGAHVQKPLWASTSTKNPEYSDVRYVENLIGENTVNTLPDETIDAFVDHGKIRPNSVEENVDGAYETLEMAEEINIDMEDVTSQLVGEGIRKFISPYEDLLESIEEKSGALVS